MRYPDCAFLVRFTLFECREERRVPDVLLAGSARTTSRDLFGIEPLLEMSSYPKSAQRGQRSFQKSGASVCLFQKANMLRRSKRRHQKTLTTNLRSSHDVPFRLDTSLQSTVVDRGVSRNGSKETGRQEWNQRLKNQGNFEAKSRRTFCRGW